MAKVIETDVLIVGTGPDGGAMAALLSMYGIRNMVVTKWKSVFTAPLGAHPESHRRCYVDLRGERRGAFCLVPVLRMLRQVAE